MNAMLLVELIFWTCLTLVVFAYVGYPMTLWALSRCFGKRTRPPQASADLPRVSLLIAAHNEEAEIEARLQSALRMDYPKDRLEIVIASDGSSDRTASIVRRYARDGVRLLDYPERRGKSAVLNDAFGEVTGEIVLLSDANTHITPEGLGHIVRWFADPEIGVVCGRLVLHDPATGKNADSLYWRYETFLKQCESRLGGLLGANGAIYAIRRRLYQPIPDGTIVDDFVIPLRAKLRTGCRIVYDRDAVANEETPAGIGSEFKRRSRIGAGGAQSLGMLWPLLHPRHGWTAFTFLAHKVLRWLCPFFLLALLATNLILSDAPLYQALLVAQIGFYLLSVLSAFVPPEVKLLKPLRLTTMFTGMNTALLVGYWRWLLGKQKGVWKPTARLAQV